ncbi:MAG: dimethylsulfonioproprionate lyase family protein [Pseudomonadota bacterium]
MTPVWTNLLTQARALHAAVPELSEFCPFPEVTVADSFTAQVDPLCATLASDDTLIGPYPGFQSACTLAAPHAWWRGTYRDTAIGDVLHAHFGTFEMLGQDTPLKTDAMRGFMIYQRPGYHYPLHHHPAEEIYLVLAGQAEFTLEGTGTQTLGPGQTAYHASNAPHALTTTEHSILAYVLWRGDITIKPVFTYPETLS